jgi:hypothetical protein
MRRIRDRSQVLSVTCQFDVPSGKFVFAGSLFALRMIPILVILMDGNDKP